MERGKLAEKWRGWAQWVKGQGKRYSGLKGVYRGPAGKISTAVVKKRKRVLKLKMKGKGYCS